MCNLSDTTRENTFNKTFHFFYKTQRSLNNFRGPSKQICVYVIRLFIIYRVISKAGLRITPLSQTSGDEGVK